MTTEIEQIVMDLFSESSGEVDEITPENYADVIAFFSAGLRLLIAERARGNVDVDKKNYDIEIHLRPGDSSIVLQGWSRNMATDKHIHYQIAVDHELAAAIMDRVIAMYDEENSPPATTA